MVSIRVKLFKLFEKFGIKEIEYYNGEFALNVNDEYVYTNDIHNYLPVYINLSDNKEFSMTRVLETVALHIPSLRHKWLYYEEVDDWFITNTTFCEIFSD